MDKMHALPPDIVEAIDRFIDEHPTPLTRGEVIELGLREWFIATGMMPLQPPDEELH